MKSRYKRIGIMVVAAMVLFCGWSRCGASGKKDMEFWGKAEPNRPMKWVELTDEGTERIMARLAEKEPEKAKELEKLREEDPNKFKEELGKIMRMRMRERFREHRKERSERSGRTRGLQSSKPGMRQMMPPGKVGFGSGSWKQHRHMELAKWLEGNYPEKAKELKKLQKKHPALYEKKCGLALKKYDRIMRAGRDKPRLAKALKQDLELKSQRDELLEKIKATTDDSEKEQLTKELQEIVGARFDLILKRKQIKYEHLRKKLTKLEQKVQKNEAEVDKWKDMKQAKVQERIGELVSDMDKFKWD